MGRTRQEAVQGESEAVGFLLLEPRGTKTQSLSPRLEQSLRQQWNCNLKAHLSPIDLTCYFRSGQTYNST